MGKRAIQPKFKVWVVFGERVKFGDGRAQLLELIDRLGSIQKAVAEFGMSYRNAWGYLRDLQDAAGFPLLQRGPGGGPASGTRLTPKGREFVARYWRYRRGVEDSVGRQFKRAFRPK
jgi:molybdate transport system regulatory protein